MQATVTRARTSTWWSGIKLIHWRTATLTILMCGGRSACSSLSSPLLVWDSESRLTDREAEKDSSWRKSSIDLTVISMLLVGWDQRPRCRGILFIVASERWFAAISFVWKRFKREKRRLKIKFYGKWRWSVIAIQSRKWEKQEIFSDIFTGTTV